MVVPLHFSKGYCVPPADVKSELRRAFKAKRDDFVDRLSVAEKDIAFSHLPSPLAAICTPGAIVAGYVAKGSEADPSKLLQAAAELGCTLALPHVTSKVAPMRFVQWNIGDPLEPGAFGLMQPVATANEVVPDIILVPLVAYDSQLMRLGQGAAHYDRALSLLPDAVAVGIGWSIQQADILPVDPWDAPLDALLTEKSWTSR
ncbi:MAG: 5-formyltetrahydrofolate cyclo-ligase [Sphingomonadales bacterium]|jgi:5-formyltetrahydrofolate cyclo-ligase|nr:5-formyltetrahydrofolate cyclo-ligase [Sphingomonadales bacterium]MBK9003380.1 5-formyltetrahydrofolate cyclo-ligase [Sphingomonadales bacterium]MBK9268633.1 5-formyltetrahydrofolate cyclo-ligase [Sphingomonadales bacterium]MBP6434516.1 5-formyltetrahydrofolate cyclo-ligase [Sphingorhabdus sp.]